MTTEQMDATDVAPKKPSRLAIAQAKSEREQARLEAPDVAEAHEDFTRAEDRFANFRRRFKHGRHDAEVVHVIQHPDGHLTYVVKASVWKWDTGEGLYPPDATALVSRSTRDADPITAANPLATADTVARSRALRNAGILATKKKPKPEA